MIVDLFLFRDPQEQLESRDHLDLLDEGFVCSLSSCPESSFSVFSVPVKQNFLLLVWDLHLLCVCVCVCVPRCTRVTDSG